MRITSFRVLTLDHESRQLTWTVSEEGTREDYFDYELRVERSESAEGPFTPISPWFQGHMRFLDPNVPTGHRYRQIHYRLCYRRVGSEEESYGPVGTLGADPSPEAKEIRRQLYLLYRNGKGRMAWLLPVRTTGRRCSSCWDHVTGQRTRSKCFSCFDTGWFQGYLYPVAIYIDIDPSSSDNQPSQPGNFQQNITTARMPHYPGVKPGDVIIEGENHRWVVSSLSTTEHERAQLEQHLNLVEVADSGIEMKIPLKLDKALEDLRLSPHQRKPPRADPDSVLDESAAIFFRFGGS